MGGFNKFTN